MAQFSAVPQVHGLRGYASPRSAVAAPSMRVGRKRAQGIRCDYIGSATNQVRIPFPFQTKLRFTVEFHW
jgi:photosystem I subunit X